MTSYLHVLPEMHFRLEPVLRYIAQTDVKSLSLSIPLSLALSHTLDLSVYHELLKS